MSSKKIKVKPGKTESKVGFAVEILFVILGIVVVIPIFGLFGVIWTGVAAIIAFAHYKNAFTDEGVVTHEIVIEDGLEGVKQHDAGKDIEAKLMKLNSLYEQRLITKEEYDEKRKEILKDF